MKGATVLITAILLIAAGIAGFIFVNSYLLAPAALTGASYSSLGEQIYFTGIGENGPISFTGGPHWLYMMGGSYVSCHGEDGRGGFVIMMTSITAPDIRYGELIEEGMDEEEIAEAITEGRHEGEELSPVMPRWQMSKKEVEAVIDFLKELDSK